MQEKTDGKQIAPLSSLIQDPVNARKHNERNIEEICRSLREFGQHAPLVVQRSTGRVLVGQRPDGGHGASRVEGCVGGVHR